MALLATIALSLLVLRSEAASPAEWEEALSNRPNASSTIAVPGYNISDVYPGSPVDWRLEIRVVGGIVPDETTSDVEYLNARRLSLIPPKEIEFDPEPGSQHQPHTAFSEQKTGANSSWNVCQSWFSFFPENDIDAVDPDCEGVLPGSCIDELRSYVDSDRVCEPPRDSADVPCSGFWRSSEYEGLSGNETSVDLDVFSDYGPDDNQNPFTFYDIGIASVHVGVFSWRSPVDKSNASRTETPGSFRCIRASNFSDGSRTLDEVSGPPFGEDEEEDGGAAGQQSVGFRSGLMVGVVIMVIAWMI